MESIKRWFSSPKNLIIVGLIGTLSGCLCQTIILNQTIRTIDNSLFYELLCSIGGFIYFLVVFLRIKGKKIDIKISQKILVYICFICGIMHIIDMLYPITIGIFLCHLVFGLYLTFLFNNKKYISNKVIIVISIIYIILSSYYDHIAWWDYFHIYGMEWYSYFYRLVRIIGIISTTPYFYNYYNLIREENK